MLLCDHQCISTRVLSVLTHHTWVWKFCVLYVFVNIVMWCYTSERMCYSRKKHNHFTSVLLTSSVSIWTWSDNWGFTERASYLRNKWGYYYDHYLTLYHLGKCSVKYFKQFLSYAELSLQYSSQYIYLLNFRFKYI